MENVEFSQNSLRADCAAVVTEIKLLEYRQGKYMVKFGTVAKIYIFVLIT